MCFLMWLTHDCLRQCTVIQVVFEGRPGYGINSGCLTLCHCSVVNLNSGACSGFTFFQAYSISILVAVVEVAVAYVIFISVCVELIELISEVMSLMFILISD